MLQRVTLLRHSIHHRTHSFRAYVLNYTWRVSLNRNGAAGGRTTHSSGVCSSSALRAAFVDKDIESYKDHENHENHENGDDKQHPINTQEPLYPSNPSRQIQIFCPLNQISQTLSSLPPSHLLSPSKLHKLMKHHTHPSRCAAGDVQGVYEGVLGFFMDRLCASGGRGLMGLNTSLDTSLDGKGTGKGGGGGGKDKAKQKSNITPHLLTQTLFILDRIQDKGLLLSNRTIGMLLVLVGSVYSPFYVVRRPPAGGAVGGGGHEDTIVGTTTTTTTTSTRGRRKPLPHNPKNSKTNKPNPTQTLTLLLALVQEPSYTAQNLHELVRFIRGVAVDRERGRGVWAVVVEAFREAREGMVVHSQEARAVAGIGNAMQDEDGGEDVEEDREWSVMDDVGEHTGVGSVAVDPNMPRYAYNPPLHMLPAFIEAAVRAGKVDDAFRMLGDAITLSQSRTRTANANAHPKIIDAHLAFLQALRHSRVWDTEAYGRVLAGMAELEGVGGSDVDVEVEVGQQGHEHSEEAPGRQIDEGEEKETTPIETPHQSQIENEKQKQKAKETAETRRQNGKAANVRSKVLEEVTRQMVGVGDWEGAFAVWRGVVGAGSLDRGEGNAQGEGGLKLGTGMYAVLFSVYGKMGKMFPPSVTSHRPALEPQKLESQEKKKGRGRKGSKAYEDDEKAIEKQKTPEKETAIPSPRELYRYFSRTFTRPRSLAREGAIVAPNPSSTGSLASPSITSSTSTTSSSPSTLSTISTTTNTKSGVYKNTQLLNVLLRGFMRQGDYPAALAVLRQFTNAGAEINHVTYYTVVKALVQRIWYECGIGRVVVPSSPSEPSPASSSSAPASPPSSSLLSSPSPSKAISLGTWTTRFLGTPPTHKPRLGMTLVNHILHHVSLERFDVGQRVYPDFARGAVDADVGVDVDGEGEGEGAGCAGDKEIIKPQIQGFNTIADPQRGGLPTTPTPIYTTANENAQQKQKYPIPTMHMMEHVHRPKPVGFVYERVPLERLLERAVWALCEDVGVGVEKEGEVGKGGGEGEGNKAEEWVREIVERAEEEMTR